MDSFIYSINATMPIFFIMLLGGFLRKKNIIDEHFANVANKLVFNITLPVMVFEDLANSDFKEHFDVKFVVYCMVVTFISISVIWFATEIFMKEEKSKGSFIQGAYRSSAAILGMAFIKNVYNDTGMAPLMIIASVPLYNIFAVIILSFKGGESDGKPDYKKTLLDIIKNPIIIGILLGIIASLLEIEFPVIANKTISMIGSITTPLALICIGATFKGSAAIRKIKPTIIATSIKLVILPGIFLPVAVALGFRTQELMAIVIMLGSPTTVSSYIMAKNMKNDEVLASSIIVLTTLLSSVSLTAIIFILRSFNLL